MLHAINAGYALAVFWMYVAALAFGMCTIFFFPQMAVVLVFLGLLFLGPALIGSKVLFAVERRLARQSLRRRVCPRCGEQIIANSGEVESWRCEYCQTEYLPSGLQSEPDQRISSAETL
jgi:ribosomal protein S27AE